MKRRTPVLLAASLLLPTAPAHALLYERADMHPGQSVVGIGWNDGYGVIVGGSYGLTPTLSVGAMVSQHTRPSVVGTLKLGETPFGLSYGVSIGYVEVGLSTPHPATGLTVGRFAGAGLPFAARLGGPDSPLMLRGDLVRVHYPLSGETAGIEWMNVEIAYRWGILELKTGTRSPLGIRFVF